MDVDETKMVNNNMEDVEICEMNELNLNNELCEKLLSPEKLVQSSFQHFLQTNSHNNLNLKILSQWNFVQDLENRVGIKLDTEAVLKKLPNLGSQLSYLKGGKLIKFNCMIQNILENQFYLAFCRDKLNKDEFRVNKYFEYQNNSMMVDNDDDLFGDSDYDTKDNILMDRLALNCVALPGLSSDLAKLMQIGDNLRKKKIIVLDYENSQVKVNQEILVIGVAYEIDDTIVIHSWKIIQNYFKFQSDLNNQDVLNNFDFTSARKLISDYLKLIFNGDELLAEYMNLFLVAQIFFRLETKNIGKLLINIINQVGSRLGIEEEFDYFAGLQSFLARITNFSKSFDVTIDSMNKNYLFSRFDVNTEELIQGEFQTVDHTFILLDERKLKEGKLNDNGCKNFNLIKTLIDFQSISYHYPYSTIEMHHDTQILTVSDSCKSMFSSNELIEIPFLNGLSSYKLDEHRKNLDLYFSNINERDISVMRRYLDVCRYSEEFAKKFKIDDEVSKMIQRDFVENKNEDFSAEDLDMCIKIGRLYAISNGRTELVLDDYIFAKDCESKRKNRLLQLKKKI